MKLELAILAGADSKAFLADFAKQIDRLEKLTGALPATAAVSAKKSAGPAPVVQEEDDEDTAVEAAADEDDDEFTAPKKKAAAKKAQAAAFEDEEESAEATEDEESFEAPAAAAPAAKKKAVKKLTEAEHRNLVNAACKERAERTSFEDTKAFLKKKFKVSSIMDLKQEQFDTVIAAMKA